MPTDPRRVPSQSGGSLLAWIKRSAHERFVAAFVGADAAADRAPATHLCATREEAQRWVENEAAALSVPIHWVNDGPTG
jgi:hypothetical protein